MAYGLLVKSMYHLVAKNYKPALAWHDTRSLYTSAMNRGHLANAVWLQASYALSHSPSHRLFNSSTAVQDLPSQSSTRLLAPSTLALEFLSYSR